MTGADLLADLERRGLPARKFWEDDLDTPAVEVLQATLADGFLDKWMKKRTRQQTTILNRVLGGNGAKSTRGMKASLKTSVAPLLPFVLASRFAKGKSKVAVVGVARSHLPRDLQLLAQTDDVGEAFDVTALVFGLYWTSSEALQTAFHLDKVHKTGFARMRMRGTPEKPSEPIANALPLDKIQKILDTYAPAVPLSPTTAVKGAMSLEGRYFIFIRRPERRDRVLNEVGVVHGRKPEWIILDFDADARTVNIASHSVEESLEIANRVASAYYKGRVEYENESEPTAEAQVEALLTALRNEQDAALVLVEALTHESPLHGSVAVRLASPHSRPIGRALIQMEAALGSPLDVVPALHSVKVLFRQKRVSLIFEPVEGSDSQYVVRYSDQRLNGLERRLFEAHMRETHAITVLSTEKRFKRARGRPGTAAS